MYPAPQIDVYCGRVFLSELPVASSIFARNGYRLIDCRPGSNPSAQVYWLVAVRVRDTTTSFIHEIADITRLNAHLDDRDISQMPPYRSVHPLADLSPEETEARPNATPIDQMSPSDSSDKEAAESSGEES